MPSLELVEVLVEEQEPDDAGLAANPGYDKASPVRDTNPVDALTTNTSLSKEPNDKQQQQEQRKITPATEHRVVKKKVQQQLTMGAFFTKSKATAVPTTSTPLMTRPRPRIVNMNDVGPPQTLHTGAVTARTTATGGTTGAPKAVTQKRRSKASRKTHAGVNKRTNVSVLEALTHRPADSAPSRTDEHVHDDDDVHDDAQPLLLAHNKRSELRDIVLGRRSSRRLQAQSSSSDSPRADNSRVKTNLEPRFDHSTSSASEQQVPDQLEEDTLLPSTDIMEMEEPVQSDEVKAEDQPNQERLDLRMTTTPSPNHSQQESVMVDPEPIQEAARMMEMEDAINAVESSSVQDHAAVVVVVVDAIDKPHHHHHDDDWKQNHAAHATLGTEGNDGNRLGIAPHNNNDEPEALDGDDETKAWRPKQRLSHAAATTTTAEHASEQRRSSDDKPPPRTTAPGPPPPTQAKNTADRSSRIRIRRTAAGRKNLAPLHGASATKTQRDDDDNQDAAHAVRLEGAGVRAAETRLDPPGKLLPSGSESSRILSTVEAESGGALVTAGTESAADLATTTESKQSDNESMAAAAALLQKHAAMKENYCHRITELLRRCREGIAEEDFVIAIPDDDAKVPDTVMVGNDAFPDFAVKTLASLIEGSSASLSSLSLSAASRLNQIYKTDVFTRESTTAKLKLLATRKNYVKPLWIATAAGLEEKAEVVNLDLFEDENNQRMWRWEVSLLDLFPDPGVVAQLKKARTARKKLSSHVGALSKLLLSLHEADKLIGAGNSNAKMEKLLARISQEEEKVLKFEREEEKTRLAADERLKKGTAKAQELEKKKAEAQEEKQALAEQRKKEKELKKVEAAQEKQRKKVEAARQREDLKRKQALEDEERDQKERAQKEIELKKQKACLASFFAAQALTKKAPSTKGDDSPEKTSAVTVEIIDVDPVLDRTGFDADTFRSRIGSEDKGGSAMFRSLSSRARQSRRRRTKLVPVTVVVAVYPDDAFDAQPYAEKVDVQVMNRFKFFLFHEDVRPPYHGTWSKKSTIVTGRTPFGQDAAHLDYDNDSEAEWEEGDNEVGEDLENDAGDDEDEKEEDQGDENEDGWLAAEDDIDFVDGEMDEETRLLLQKQREAEGAHNQNLGELAVLSICPIGGRPISQQRVGLDSSVETLCEGVGFEEACELSKAHTCIVVNDSDIYLDAFPPTLIDEQDQLSPGDGADKSSASKDMSDDDLKIFVRFIHQCTFGSRDKVVDEFRIKHNSITSSRAQALRALDVVAEKKKHPTNGVYWEARREVIERLGLTDLSETAVIDATGVKQDALRTVAAFVHHCTLKSKDRVVDELRSKHESLASSRAEAVRLLESVAEKKKHPVSGVYWEVKESVRQELGLESLPNSPPSMSTDMVASSTSPANDDLAAGPVPETDARNATVPTSASMESERVGGLEMSVTDTRPDNLSDCSSKKRKAPGNASGSAKLLAAFLKKKRHLT